MFSFQKLINFNSAIFLVPVLLSACKKEGEAFIQGSEIIVPVIDTTLILGDSTINGFVVIQPPIIVNIPWHSKDSIDIDIDNDSINDFQIGGFWNVSPGGVNIRSSFIKTLNNTIKLHVISHIDSLISWTDSSSGSTTYYSENYIGGTTYPTNAIINIDILEYIARLSFGEILFPNSSYWKEGTFPLANINQSESPPWSPIYISNTTLGFWSTNGISYVAFKIDNGNSVKLGWLQMNVTGGTVITIYSKGIKEMQF